MSKADVSLKKAEDSTLWKPRVREPRGIDQRGGDFIQGGKIDPPRDNCAAGYEYSHEPRYTYPTGTQDGELGVAAISSFPRLRPLQHNEKGEDNGHRKNIMRRIESTTGRQSLRLNSDR